MSPSVKALLIRLLILVVGAAVAAKLDTWAIENPLAYLNVAALSALILLTISEVSATVRGRLKAKPDNAVPRKEILATKWFQAILGVYITLLAMLALLAASAGWPVAEHAFRPLFQYAVLAPVFLVLVLGRFCPSCGESLYENVKVALFNAGGRTESVGDIQCHKCGVHLVQDV